MDTSGQLSRGVLCATKEGNLVRKSYRTIDGVWYRRYISMGPIALMYAPGQGSEKEQIEDCNKCKHKFRCLIDRECDQVFESR